MATERLYKLPKATQLGKEKTLGGRQSPEAWPASPLSLCWLPHRSVQSHGTITRVPGPHMSPSLTSCLLLAQTEL